MPLDHYDVGEESNNDPNFVNQLVWGEISVPWIRQTSLTTRAEIPLRNFESVRIHPGTRGSVTDVRYNEIVLAELVGFHLPSSTQVHPIAFAGGAVVFGRAKEGITEYPFRPDGSQERVFYQQTVTDTFIAFVTGCDLSVDVNDRMSIAPGFRVRFPFRKGWAETQFVRLGFSPGVGVQFRF